MTSKRLQVADSLFLYGESPETMMHVASLLPFTPAPDAGPEHLRHLLDELRAARDIQPPWNLRLRYPDFLKHPLQSWVSAEDVDVDYHVRRSALPAPGDERELGVLVSRLHSNPVDFSRPPWEVHLIEGLEGGRFALYVKVHHALVDGFTSMRILARSFTTSPEERDTAMFVSVPPTARVRTEGSGSGLTAPELLRLARAQLDSSREVGRAALDVYRAARGGDGELDRKSVV